MEPPESNGTLQLEPSDPTDYRILSFSFNRVVGKMHPWSYMQPPIFGPPIKVLTNNPFHMFDPAQPTPNLADLPMPLQ